MIKIFLLPIIMIIIIPMQLLFAQWTKITSGLTNENVISLAIKSNGDIYAGTYNDGVYRSTDNGSSWTLVLGQMVYVYEVFSFAFDSYGYIYAGTYQKGLFRSTNDGDSWGGLSNDAPGNNLPLNDIRAVAISPTGTIFASDYGSIYSSTDNGSNWYEVRHSSGGSAGGFQTIAIDSPRVYIGGSNDWFYYSTNDGSTWTWVGSSSGLTYAPLRLAVNDSGYIFAGTSGGGVFRSTNGGVNWTAVNTNLGNLYINTIAINSSNVIYVGTTGGIYVSTNNGLNWASNNSELTNTDIRSLAFNNLGDVYAGAYKSSGNGGLWQSSAILPVELTTFNAFEKENAAILQWNTATEVNNYGFEVERRKICNELGVASNWEKISFISGAGTSNAPREYSYSDANLASGRYAYRLKQIDQDGLFKYSQSLEVEIGSAPKVLALEQNYPNPFNPTTTIEFTVPEDGHVSLMVYNSLGQLVETLFDGEARAGYIQKATFNASRLSSGVYFSRMQYNETTLLKKLVLMK